jgi:hypothetical protein
VDQHSFAALLTSSQKTPHLGAAFPLPSLTLTSSQIAHMEVSIQCYIMQALQVLSPRPSICLLGNCLTTKFTPHHVLETMPTEQEALSQMLNWEACERGALQC